MHPDASKLLFEEEVGRWPPDLAEKYGWIFHAIVYPLIDCEFRREGRTPLRVQMHCDDWDDQPPSITFHNSAGQPLPTLPPNPTGVFNPSAHPVTGKPFACTAGTREYHTHSSHLDQRWTQFKGKSDFQLGAILTKLWRAWLKGSG